MHTASIYWSGWLSRLLDSIFEHTHVTWHINESFQRRFGRDTSYLPLHVYYPKQTPYDNDTCSHVLYHHLKQAVIASVIGLHFLYQKIGMQLVRITNKQIIHSFFAMPFCIFINCANQVNIFYKGIMTRLRWMLNHMQILGELGPTNLSMSENPQEQSFKIL